MRQGTVMAAAVAAAVCAAAGMAVQDAEARGAVPEWVKSNIGWWADGSITEAEFLESIGYLVREGIIDISDPMPDTITIGFIPVEKAGELTSRAEVLEAFLEERLETDVELAVPTSYEPIIEGMRFGHIDAAFMDAGPAWIAHERTGAEVVLAELVDGKVNYQATVWGLAEDDSLRSLEDTVGKRVAFTSITGSSGFVMPVGALVSGGHIDIPGDDIVALEMALAESFESHNFAGSYKPALELLLNGNVDAAFGSDNAPAKYLDPADRGRLRSVAAVGPVPSHAFVVGPDLPGPARDALVDAMIMLNYDEHNQILRDLYGADALVPTTTSLHMGDFGRYVTDLAGLDQLLLDKHDMSK